MSNNQTSTFNVTGAIENFSEKCTYTDIRGTGGSYSYNFACIPSNATDSSQAYCIKLKPNLFQNLNCDSFFKGEWRNSSEYEGLSCAGNCDAPILTESIGSGSLIQPNFILLFVLLFIMVFNRH